jgi:activator of HSP90 ATPase
MDRGEGGEKMKTKTIRQFVTFKASPHEVFETLMDSRKHARFTGERAHISRRIGGRFVAYNGYIEGANLNLVPDKKIVQSWRGSDWPKNHYSRATFSLKKVKNGTRLTFTQRAVPDQYYHDIRQGWRDYYWKPMKERLEKGGGVRAGKGR